MLGLEKTRDYDVLWHVNGELLRQPDDSRRQQLAGESRSRKFKRHQGLPAGLGHGQNDIT